MQHFTFEGPAGCSISITQDSSGVIGCKLYPGALLLCSYLAHQPLPPGSTVLELGAGACGLPSFWLSRSGCRVIATDSPSVLPLLEANIAANSATAPPGAPPLLCTPLHWGTAQGPGSVPALHATLQGQPRVDYIVAADVVYHDEFIAPLLAALLQLTEPPPLGQQQAEQQPWAPPLILLSYVQRFKRARRFFKLAAAHFEVAVLAGAGASAQAPSASTPGGGLVVDYDTLSWALPKVLQCIGSGGAAGTAAAAPPHIKSSYASLAAYQQLLLQAGAAGEGAGGSSAGSAGSAAPPQPSTSKHAIDSDSEDEWEQSESYARAFAASVGGQGEAGGGAEAGEATTPLQAACARLGVPVPEGSQAYIYSLRRKVK